jgi:hypothetical protein
MLRSQIQSLFGTDIAAWANNKLSGAWGKKAAARVYHICDTGKDIEFGDPFAAGVATEKPIRYLGRVPGCPFTHSVKSNELSTKVLPLSATMHDWGRRMSNWQAEQAERNRKSLARLTKALPAIFPPAVLARALNCPFIPPTPRLAIDSYWRAHPIRADRLARALAARSGAPKGWTWQLGNNRKTGLPTTFRTPPAPYRERV